MMAIFRKQIRGYLYLKGLTNVICWYDKNHVVGKMVMNIFSIAVVKDIEQKDSPSMLEPLG